MNLNEANWIYPAGITAEWKWVASHRSRDALSRLRAAGAALSKTAPDAVRNRRYLEGLRSFGSGKGAAHDGLARHPAVDYWLFLRDRHFSQPCSDGDWELQLSVFQGLAAFSAASEGRRADLDALLDPDGRLCLYGSPYFIQYPPEHAFKPVRIEVRGRRLAVLGPGELKVELSLESLAALPSEGRSFGAARAGRSLEAAPGIVVDDSSWLLMHGVSMHGLAHLDAPAKERFCAVLKQALSDMARTEPALIAEMTDLVRVLVPLENPMNYGSVSSSYVNARGMICLSHSEDPLLQAETLIHEFSHQKLNQLMIVEPILAGGQSGQVFYSPWRPDARRLRGLLLGAHAFLNVSRYLLGTISRASFRREEGLDVMVNVAARLFQVDDALRTVASYATFTEFGRRFQLGMSRELGLLFHAIQWFPAALVLEARENAQKHRDAHALFHTGFHKSAGFVDKAVRAPFLTPGGAEKITEKP